MLRKYFLIVILILFSCVVNAQEKRDLKQEVKVVSVYKAKLKKANRIGFLPKVNDSLIKKPVFFYNIVTKPEIGFFKPSPIGAAKMKNAAMKYVMGHRLCIAGANYSSLFADYVFNNKRSEKYDFGAHLKHYSSRGTISLNDELKSKSKPNWVENYAEVYMTKFFDLSSLNASLYFDNKSMSYYGYPRIEDVPALNTNIYPYDKQSYRNLGFKAKYKTYKLKDINIDADLSYNRMSDKYKIKEDDVNFNLSLFKKQENHLLGVSMEMNFLNMKNALKHLSLVNADSRKNFSLSLNPYYTFVDDVFSLKLGMKAVKTFSDEKGFYIYPDVYAEYHIVVGLLSIMAGLDGDLKMNSYANLSRENPYIASGISGFTSKEKYHFFAGVKGNFSSKISYKSMVEYSAIDDQYFFNKSLKIDPNFNALGELYSNKFDIVADDVKVLDVNAEIAIKMKNNFNITASAHYYKYTMDKLAHPWYKPCFKMTIDADYYLIDNLKLNAGLLIVGRRRALDVGDNTLKSIYDVHFGADYRLNKYFTVFAKVNNLFAFKYYQWQDYPSQALNTWIGVRLSL